MKNNYESVCLPFTLKYEGKFSNDAHDPGGKTLEGIIQREYNQYRKAKGKPLRELSPALYGTTEWTAERDEIYRTKYWNAVGGDSLPSGIDLCVWDFGVNAGPSRALKYLKLIDQSKPIADQIQEYTAKREAYYRSLKTFQYFGRGWLARNSACCRIALELNRKPTGAIKPVPGTSIAPKTQNAPTASTMRLTAIGTMSAAIAAFWVSIPLWVKIGGPILVIGGLGYHFWKKYNAKNTTPNS